MTTKPPTKVTNGTETPVLAATDILLLLANDRRRYTLHTLATRIGSVSIEELAEQVAIFEDEPTPKHCERILTSLHHVHLPRLVEAGIVTYDADQETVRLETVAAVKPYLELAIADDLQ